VASSGGCADSCGVWDGVESTATMHFESRVLGANTEEVRGSGGRIDPAGPCGIRDSVWHTKEKPWAL
jgi:hypothetical protein